MFIVFFVSGFWHGSTAPFVLWGLLQALYRVGEELLAGSILGRSSGRLYFEARDNGTAIDPGEVLPQ